MTDVDAAAESRWRIALGRSADLRRRLAPWWGTLRVVGFGAAVAIVVATAVEAARHTDLSTLRWWPIAPAVAAAAAWWLLLARGWSLLASGTVSAGQIGVWCRTQALRFLPGGLWAPASRLTVVKGPIRERMVVVGGENLGALCGALAVGGLCFGLGGHIWWLAAAGAAAIPPLAFAVLHGRVGLPDVRIWPVTANYVLAFVIYVVQATLLQVAVSGSCNVLEVAGAAGIAWAAGLVVVFAPSGIGAREFVYIALLLPSPLTRGELAGGAVASRLVTIVAELAILIVAGRPARQTADAT